MFVMAVGRAAKILLIGFHPLTELRGMTVGIVGLGEIGGAVARIAHGFRMKVIAYTRNPGRESLDHVKWVDLDELFVRSDFVTLHCPLTPETEGMVNERRLRLMKRVPIFSIQVEDS